MRQGSPHGAHVRPFQNEVRWTRPWGLDSFGWNPSANSRASRNSSFVSVEEHTKYTTTALMQRDAPSWIDPSKDDIVSIHDDPESDVKMESIHEKWEHHTEDSSPDSGPEDSNNPSNDSDMESDQDQGSGHHLDSSSSHDSNPGLNPGSGTGSSSSSEASSNCSDDDGGDFMDMIQERGKSSNTPKKPESQPQSSSHSRSREKENQKRRHMPSPDNTPNPDELNQKKKKSKQKETPSKGHSKSDHEAESAQDKATQKFGEEPVCKFRAEEEERKRESLPKKPKKKDPGHCKEASAAQGSPEEEEGEKGKRSQNMGRPGSTTPGGEGGERKRGGQASCQGKAN